MGVKGVRMVRETPCDDIDTTHSTEQANYINRSNGSVKTFSPLSLSPSLSHLCLTVKSAACWVVTGRKLFVSLTGELAAIRKFYVVSEIKISTLTSHFITMHHFHNVLLLVSCHQAIMPAVRGVQLTTCFWFSLQLFMKNCEEKEVWRDDTLSE